MFGIGSTELIVILVVALVVVGPKHLPKVARTLGKAMGEFRKVSTDFQRSINTEIEREDMEKRAKKKQEEMFAEKKEATAEDGSDKSETGAPQDVEASEQAKAESGGEADGKAAVAEVQAEDKQDGGAKAEEKTGDAATAEAGKKDAEVGA